MTQQFEMKMNGRKTNSIRCNDELHGHRTLFDLTEYGTNSCRSPRPRCRCLGPFSSRNLRSRHFRRTLHWRCRRISKRNLLRLLLWLRGRWPRTTFAHRCTLRKGVDWATSRISLKEAEVRQQFSTLSLGHSDHTLILRSRVHLHGHLLFVHSHVSRHSSNVFHAAHCNSKGVDRDRSNESHIGNARWKHGIQGIHNEIVSFKSRENTEQCDVNLAFL